MDYQTAGRPHSGRRRNELVRAAVLDTTARLLRDRPYREVTVAAIVREARVGRQTIYRWWPTRSDLLLDALRHTAQELVGPPDPSVAFPEALRQFLVRTVRGIAGAAGASADQGVGAALRALMAEAQADDAARAALRDGFTNDRRRELRALLATGRDTGNVHECADMDLLVDMAYGSIWYRLLLGHAALDTAFAQALAAQIISVAAGPHAIGASNQAEEQHHAPRR